MTSKPLGLILAGGLARRMGGGDKGLIKIGGETILDRALIAHEAAMLAHDHQRERRSVTLRVYRLAGRA
jgi:molybdopterin-guanine dinucleotide biosynthesis protein A